MVPKKKIRVLVVDDSLLFREALSKALSDDPEIEIVAKARDAFQARDHILTYSPDVMTCDIEMPKMNGIEFIKRLIPQYPMPVVVISTISNAVFDAMNAGALDYVLKPDIRTGKEYEDFINEVKRKIKIAALAHVKKKELPDIVMPAVTPLTYKPEKQDDEDFTGEIIAMGASTGGTDALYNTLLKLPTNIPGIVIVQHIPPVFSRMFAERLNTQTEFEVKEAEGGETVESGKVYIAPGDKHMRIRKAGKKYIIDVAAGDRVNGHCPSVDILFDSVAKYAGDKAIGVIMTGMGQDGAHGLLKMKSAGAITIGQNEESSVVYGMPKVANEIGAVQTQVALRDIPNEIVRSLPKLKANASASTKKN